MAATDVLVIAAVGVAAVLLYAWWKNYSPVAIVKKAWQATKTAARAIGKEIAGAPGRIVSGLAGAGKAAAGGAAATGKTAAHAAATAAGRLVHGDVSGAGKAAGQGVVDTGKAAGRAVVDTGRHLAPKEVSKPVIAHNSHSVVNRIQNTPTAQEAWAQLRAMMAKYPSGNVPPSEKAEFDRLMKIAYGR